MPQWSDNRHLAPNFTKAEAARLAEIGQELKQVSGKSLADPIHEALLAEGLDPAVDSWGDLPESHPVRDLVRSLILRQSDLIVEREEIWKRASVRRNGESR